VTACPLGPALDSSLPDVRKAIWTLVTPPPDLAIAARPDEHAAKVHVELFMPLFLQLVSKEAGSGPLGKLLALALWNTVSASGHATCLPCRLACMLTA
jgi:hypothetical protein